MMAPLRTQDLPSLVGTKLEPTEWFEITQDRVNRFAEATDDFQFIHVDAERAAKTPFGGTIAHGYLTLSLLPVLTSESGVRPEDAVMTINYGSDGFRFLAPVRVGKRVRLCRKIVDAHERKQGQWLVKTAVTIEIEGEETPAMTGEFLALYVTD
ncbi:MAG: MaoC family dehydratase [Woeseiaceae bacterium]|jgi:acyl dehydratase